MVDSDLLEKGRLALLAGQFSDAATALETLLERNPDDGEAWFLLGSTRHRQHKLDAAKVALQNAVRLNAQHIQARFALASVNLELGDTDGALSACTEATIIAPREAQAWFCLAVAQEAARSADAALQSYDRALALLPSYAEAAKNRIALLLDNRRYDEAIAVSRNWTSKYPYSFDAQFNLGDACLTAGRYAEASKAFGRAANLSRPGDARALLHNGFALAQCERFDEAQTLLDHAASIDQALVQKYRQSIFSGERRREALRLDARSLFLLRHYDAIERCEWQERQHFLSRFRELISNAAGFPLLDRALGFRSMAMGLDLNSQLVLARQIASGVLNSLSNALSLNVANRVGGSNRRIKLGYVSPDFRSHPVGLVVADLFAWHDRDRFEVFGYALGPVDHSDVRKKIEAGCDQFVSLDRLDDDQAARRIAEDSVDILIDMAGYTDHARPEIFARRPAPLQISWLGYAATMGASWIDYLVADPLSVPYPDESFYSEAVIRVPAGQYLCSYAAESFESSPGRHAEGLPDIGLVLCAMHSPYKIDPATFALWMRLLAACDASVLWLLDVGAEAKANLCRTAESHQINPARLVFARKLPHAQHLARLQLADIVLDTPQCNGSSTVCDALAVGVPVLTCIGETFTQRAAASLLHAAGQNHMIARNLSHYESLALEHLQSPEKLRIARERITKARSSELFFRPQAWVRYLESGLESAWQRYGQGLAPESVEVAA